MRNVEWLLREATDERTLHMGERAVIDDERWRASIERIEIGGGLRVFLHDIAVRRDIAVEAASDRADQWMASQVTIAGRADIDFHDGQQTTSTTSQALLFRPARGRATYSLKAGTKFHSAGYSLDIARVTRLFDGAPPPVLRPLLEPKVPTSQIAAMPGDRLMRNLAGGLFARGLNGPLRVLMMEGAVIQLLAVQAAAAARQPIARRRETFSAQERARIGEARERLLADMRHPPTLGELAAAVGLSEKRLNAGFRAVFGATVFEVLRNERLEHARIALETGGVSLKEAAFRVGYNHPTNFINAFTAHYGASPRRYASDRG